MSYDLTGHYIKDGEKLRPVWDDPCNPGNNLQGYSIMDGNKIRPVLADGFGVCEYEMQGFSKMDGDKIRPAIQFADVDDADGLFLKCCNVGEPCLACPIVFAEGTPKYIYVEFSGIDPCGHGFPEPIEEQTLALTQQARELPICRWLWDGAVDGSDPTYFAGGDVRPGWYTRYVEILIGYPTFVVHWAFCSDGLPYPTGNYFLWNAYTHCAISNGDELRNGGDLPPPGYMNCERPSDHGMNGKVKITW